MNHDHKERRQAMSIGMCPRGCVHLTFGTTTVRLNAAEFRSFTTQLLKVLPEIEARTEEAMPSGPRNQTWH